MKKQAEDNRATWRWPDMEQVKEDMRKAYEANLIAEMEANPMPSKKMLRMWSIWDIMEVKERWGQCRRNAKYRDWWPTIDRLVKEADEEIAFRHK